MCPAQSGTFYSLLVWGGSADQAGHLKPIDSPSSELSERPGEPVAAQLEDSLRG